MDASPRSRAQRTDARRNYEHIVATAREAFAELGPDAPLDVIARRADVGSATLYRHFPTREDLLYATYRTDIADLARRAVELAEYFTPAEALERWLRDYFVPAQEERGVASMVKEALVTAPQVFSQGKEQFSNAVDSLVRAAQTSGDVRNDITTRDILRMAHGIAVSSQGALDARERMLRVMFDGLIQAKRGAHYADPLT
jgi:AcrR family transcriptional regulator